MALLRTAERPLVNMGGPAAAEDELRTFIERTQLPSPTHAGKGVVSDDHPLCTAPARSYALANADVVLLVGARLNWILHFGQPPRFATGAKILQVDIAAEEIGNNVATEVAMVGDAKRVMQQILEALDDAPFVHAKDSAWRRGLAESVAKNEAAVEGMMAATPSRWATTARCARSGTGCRPTPCSSLKAPTPWTSRARCCRPRTAHPHRRRHLRHHGRGQRLRDRGCGLQSEPQGGLSAGRFGFRLQRHGGRGGVPRRPADHLDRHQQRRHRVGSRGFEFDRKRIPATAYLPDARYERVIEAFGGRGFYAGSIAELGPRSTPRCAATFRPW